MYNSRIVFMLCVNFSVSVHANVCVGEFKGTKGFLLRNLLHKHHKEVMHHMQSYAA
jgi:hypothetical protein